MDLVLANKLVGVITGLVGAFLVAPSAFAFWRRAPGRFAVDLWNRLRALVLEPPAHHREVHLGDTASITSTVGIAFGVATGGSLQEHVEALQRSVKALTDRLTGAEEALQRESAAREGAIAACVEGVNETRRAMHQYIKHQEVENQRINGRGLPLIAVSLLLTGIPDELVEWGWGPWTAGLGVVTTVLGLLFAINSIDPPGSVLGDPAAPLPALSVDV